MLNKIMENEGLEGNIAQATMSECPDLSSLSDRDQAIVWFDHFSEIVGRYFLDRDGPGDFSRGLKAISHNYLERNKFFKEILKSDEDKRVKVTALTAYNFSCNVLGIEKEKFKIEEEKPEIATVAAVTEPKTSVLEKILSMKDHMTCIVRDSYDFLSKTEIKTPKLSLPKVNLPKYQLPKLSQIEIRFQLPRLSMPQLDYARISTIVAGFLLFLAPQMMKQEGEMIVFNSNPPVVKKAEPIEYIVPLDDYYVCGEFGKWRGARGGNNGHKHVGVDFRKRHGETYGQEVHASNKGVVIRAGWKSGYGKQVMLNHGDSIRTSYSHLSSIFVKEGDKVDWGQAVGLVGSSGYSTGPHVHVEFEKKENGKWQKFDILKYFSKTKSEVEQEKSEERKFINLGH